MKWHHVQDEHNLGIHTVVDCGRDWRRVLITITGTRSIAPGVKLRCMGGGRMRNGRRMIEREQDTPKIEDFDSLIGLLSPLNDEQRMRLLRAAIKFFALTTIDADCRGY